MRVQTKKVNPNSRVGLVKVNQEIIRFIKYNDKGRYVYEIKCNYCGYIYESTIENFRDVRRSGKACIKCSNIQNKEYFPQKMSDSQAGIIYSNYKSKSKLKGWEFELTKEQFKILIFSNCHYCGQEPDKIRLDRVKNKREMDSASLSNGVDRIDSFKGYTESNCLPCCEDCNKAKRNLEYSQFLELVRSIHNHLKL